MFYPTTCGKDIQNLLNNASRNDNDVLQTPNDTHMDSIPNNTTRIDDVVQPAPQTKSKEVQNLATEVEVKDIIDGHQPQVQPTSTTTTDDFKSRQSIRSMDISQVRGILNEANNSLSQASSSQQIDVQDMANKLSQRYTGKQAISLIVLQFMHDRLDFCAEDKVAAIRSFGEPFNKTMADALTYYVKTNKHTCATGNLPSKWGNTFATVFKHVAVCLWPNTHKKKTFKEIAKHRKLYGIRLKAGCPTGPSSAPRCTQTPKKVPKRKHDGSMFTTPPASNLQYCSREVSTKRRKQQGYSPYFDILHNDYKYVVRVFLPLMKSEAVQSLDAKVNLRLRKIMISGQYFPGNLVGKKAADVIKLNQPLIPITYATATSHGFFELEITLPTDIKDDCNTIQSIHDCWGLLYIFPRRKITRETSIDMTSCFGNARLSQGGSRKSNSEHKNTATSPNTLNLSPEQKSNNQEQSNQWNITADPKSLLHMSVSLIGDNWGDLFKGKMYHGTITKVEKDKVDQYVYFTALFEDCYEKFCLDELRDLHMITKDQYDLLKPQSNPDP